MSTPSEPDVPERPGGGRTVALSTAAYYGVILCLGLVAASLGPTLPGLAAQAGTGLGAISIILAARALGSMLCAVFVGRLYDRYPGHPLMAGGLGLAAVLMALVPLLPDHRLLALAMLALGVATGIASVGCNALVVWSHRDSPGPYVSGLHFFFGVGAFLAPTVVGLALDLGGGIAWAYWVLAAVMMPLVVWLPLLPSPAGYGPKRGERDGQPVEAGLVGTTAVFLFFYVGAEVGFGSWVYSYAVRMELTDPVGAAYLTSGFWGALTLGRLVGIPLVARVRPRYLLLADLAGGLIGLGLIILLPGSLVALWVGTLILGASLASVVPVIMAFVQRRTPITGSITGWFAVGLSGGSMTLPWLLGQLLARAGAATVLWAIFADMLLCLVLFVVLMRRHDRPVRAPSSCPAAV